MRSGYDYCNRVALLLSTVNTLTRYAPCRNWNIQREGISTREDHSYIQSKNSTTGISVCFFELVALVLEF